MITNSTDRETITISKKLYAELVDRELWLTALEQFGSDLGPGRDKAEAWYRVAAGAAAWREAEGIGLEGTATICNSISECRSSSK